jgi:hypothetical protein
LRNPWLTIRPIVLLGLAVGLGMIVQGNPGHQTLTVPERDFSVSVPKSLEGWSLEEGEGAVLATGRTWLRTIELEIVAVTPQPGQTVNDLINQRHTELKVGKTDYIVWHQGLDRKFGNRLANAYKATYWDRLLGLPLIVEYWQQDFYWPYREGYARIGLRYPLFMARYHEPDRIMIAAGLKLGR